MLVFLFCINSCLAAAAAAAVPEACVGIIVNSRRAIVFVVTRRCVIRTLFVALTDD